MYAQDFSEDRCYRSPLISFESRVPSVVSVKKEICFFPDLPSLFWKPFMVL